MNECLEKRLSVLKMCGVLLSVAMTLPLLAGQKAGLAKDGKLPAGQLRLANCQFPVSADIRENARWIRKQMREASWQKADIAHFCESALTGYANRDLKSMDDIDWDLLHKVMTKERQNPLF